MAITPIFAPMGVREDNWPATVGIFSGIFAKEVVVGTLDALYSSLARGESGEDEVEPSIRSLLVDSARTVPANLYGLGDMVADPLGLSFGDLSNRQQVAEEQS